MGLFVSAGVSLFALLGFAGRSWWILELAGHFRIQYFWGSLIGMALLVLGGRTRAAIAFGCLLPVHTAMLLPFYPIASTGEASPGKPRIRVVSLNLLVENQEHEKVLQFIREASPDVALFLEVDSVWGEVLEQLSADWPYSHTRPQHNNFGIAIYSRIPLHDLEIKLLGKRYPAIIATLKLGESPLTIFAGHPMSPMERERHRFRDWQLKRFGQLISETPGEKLLIGDLNCTSWSPAFSDLIQKAGLRDSRTGRGVQPSWPTKLPPMMRIPIDHCLVSPGVEIIDRRTGPNVGSDHLPIIVDLMVR